MSCVLKLTSTLTVPYILTILHESFMILPWEGITNSLLSFLAALPPSLPSFPSLSLPSSYLSSLSFSFFLPFMTLCVGWQTTIHGQMHFYLLCKHTFLRLQSQSFMKVPCLLLLCNPRVAIPITVRLFKL